MNKEIAALHRRRDRKHGGLRVRQLPFGAAAVSARRGSRIVREADIPIVARLPFDPRFAESSDRGRIFVSEFSEAPIAKQLTEMARQIDSHPHGEDSQSWRRRFQKRRSPRRPRQS